jgi:hypothetical protein
MYPEGVARESYNSRSGPQANTTEPDGPFGDPYEVRYDDFENAGSCHPGIMPLFGTLSESGPVRALFL